MWAYYQSVLTVAFREGYKDWRSYATLAVFGTAGVAHTYGRSGLSIPWPWLAWGLVFCITAAVLGENHHRFATTEAERDQLRQQLDALLAPRVSISGVHTPPRLWDRLANGTNTWRTVAAVVVKNFTRAPLHRLQVRLVSCSPGDGFWHKIADDLPYPLREHTDDPSEGQPFRTEFTLPAQDELVFIVADHIGPNPGVDLIHVQLASHTIVASVDEFRRVRDSATGERVSVRGRYRLKVRATADEMGTPVEQDFFFTTDEKGRLVFRDWKAAEDEPSPER